MDTPHAYTGWLADAWAILEARAARPGAWTADDLRDLGMAEPARPNHLGVLFRKAQRAGLIVQTGFRESRRRQRHGGAIRVWIGAEHLGRAAA